MWVPAERSRRTIHGSSVRWGILVRSYRVERKLTQEDMISYGFSVRHWQMVESGRPITLFTLLRICEAFDVAPEELVEGLAHHLRKRKRS